jgi:hypothetical protein
MVALFSLIGSFGEQEQLSSYSMNLDIKKLAACLVRPSKRSLQDPQPLLCGPTMTVGSG